jgi:hypothetical protein
MDKPAKPVRGSLQVAGSLQVNSQAHSAWFADVPPYGTQPVMEKAYDEFK